VRGKDGKQYHIQYTGVPFEDVVDDAASVRTRLESHLQDPEVVQDFLSCTRAEDGK
jgi:hypothetical protein